MGMTARFLQSVPFFLPMFLSNTALFARRGLMLDISRNRVPTVETLHSLVDALQALNYNELQLYTEPVSYTHLTLPTICSV